MRVKIEKQKIIEINQIFIECGASLENDKAFYYLEMQPAYSVHEHVLFQFKDFRKNSYIDEYELILDMLLEKGYVDLLKLGLEEIHIDD